MSEEVSHYWNANLRNLLQIPKEKNYWTTAISLCKFVSIFLIIIWHMSVILVCLQWDERAPQCSCILKLFTEAHTCFMAASANKGSSSERNHQISSPSLHQKTSSEYWCPIYIAFLIHLSINWKKVKRVKWLNKYHLFFLLLHRE